MKIIYIMDDCVLTADRSYEQADRQEAWKQELQNCKGVKFCLFQGKTHETLLVFQAYAHHAAVARRFLEMDQSPINHFAGAGTIRRRVALFGSETCKSVFGYDAPAEEGCEQRIEDALKEDRFFQ